MTIVGHPQVIRYLHRGLKRGLLSPSLLFAGPNGVGKKKVALELAKSFLCSQKNPEAFFPFECSCNSCLRVDSHNHSDLLLLNGEFQAALLGEKKETQLAVKIESIRYLEKFLQLKPLEGRRRVAIVDDAEKMTIESANALLKVLEEPPPNAQIVLIAQNLRNFPPTIPSRCAVLRFGTLPEKDISQWLVQFGNFEVGKAEEIASQAGGSLKRALELVGEEGEDVDIGSFAVDEFFEWLQESSWKREGKVRAAKFINHLIGVAQKKMERGDLDEARSLEFLLSAQDELTKHVPHKIVLENLFLKLNPVFGHQKG